jgi:hypothetical protein
MAIFWLYCIKIYYKIDLNCFLFICFNMATRKCRITYGAHIIYFFGHIVLHNTEVQQ